MSALSEKTKIKNEIKSLDAQLATADASVKAQLEQKKAELTQQLNTINSNLAAKSQQNFSSAMNGISSISGGIFDTASSMMGNKPDTIDQGVNMVADFAGQFGPWGQVAKVGLQGLNFLDKALGPKIDGFDGNTGVAGYSDFSVNGDQFRLTQMGAADQLRQEKADKLDKYSQAMANVDAANQWNAASAQAADNTMSNVQEQQNGGYSAEILTAKKGTMLKRVKSIAEKVDRKKKLTKKRQKNKDKEDTVQQFYAGGAVIPSGALHKNKHHIEDQREDLDGNITKKGIPVITIEEGGEIVQHAEVEKEEIIIPLSLTKQIEKLWKEGTDEAAIEAGKLFTKMLLTDTEDNVGLIEKIENEG